MKFPASLLSLFLRLAPLGLLAPFASAQTNWTLGRMDLPGVTGAYDIAYGNGRFVATLSGVAVGNVSPPAAAWSTDGIKWNASSLTFPTSGSLIFSAGAFYLAGSNRIFRSIDGNSWTTIYTDPDFSVLLRGLASDGKTMMVGASSGSRGFFLYSRDLVTWQAMPALPNSTIAGTTTLLKNPVYGIDRYLACYDVREPAPSFNLTPRAATSLDGGSWTAISAPPGIVNGMIIAGNGRFLAMGIQLTYVSLDGAVFTSQAAPSGLINNGPLAFAGGRFFMTRTLDSSSDGLAWSPLAPTGFPTNAYPRAIAYGRGRYVAVGSYVFENTELIAYLTASAPPLVASSPAAQTVVEGTSTSFTVTLENPDTATTYQWKRDGVALPGATAPSLTLARATPADAGRYTCTITNALGTVTSDSALLTVVPIAQAGRIINLSVLTSLDAPDTDFTLGFVLGGAGTSGPKSLLVRAAGPSLAPFGITNFLPDPKLRFFANGTFAGENNDWLGTAPLTALIAQTGAFTYTGPTSKDAAFSPANLTTASNTVVVASATPGAGTGSVIAEVYDATPDSAITATTPRLINVSVLKAIPIGGTVTAGFVIGGVTPKTVLIRATGPALAALGVPGTLADPRLTFYQTGTAVALATNDNWSGTQTLNDAFIAVGAFPLDPTSRDSALLLTLQPGSYTAQASGVGSSAGTALVEIYEIP